jgi:hypothetical protein
MRTKNSYEYGDWVLPIVKDRIEIVPKSTHQIGNDLRSLKSASFDLSKLCDYTLKRLLNILKMRGEIKGFNSNGTNLWSI